MTRWTCPACRRQFGRSAQGHECAPAMSIGEYFSTGPPHERPVFDAVNAHLQSLGEVYVEPVSVGIFFKVSRVFVQLRPMTRWVACGMSLPNVVANERIARKVVPAARGRFFHVVNLAEAGDVDEQMRDWLTESYVSEVESAPYR